MSFLEELEEHGECKVYLENDLVAELHQDIETSTDGATGRTVVTFTDGDNEEHRFYADTVVNFSTHPSHFENK